MTETPQEQAPVLYTPEMLAAPGNEALARAVARVRLQRVLTELAAWPQGAFWCRWCQQPTLPWADPADKGRPWRHCGCCGRLWRRGPALTPESWYAQALAGNAATGATVRLSPLRRMGRGSRSK